MLPFCFSGIGILSIPYALFPGGWLSLVLLILFIYLELFFVATGFLILEGDNLHKLSPDFALKLGSMILDGRLSFVILSGIAMLPSMWLNDLSALPYVSAGGVLSSIVIVVFVFCVGDLG